MAAAGVATTPGRTGADIMCHPVRALRITWGCACNFTCAVDGCMEGSGDWECGKEENDDGWCVCTAHTTRTNEKRKRAPRQRNGRALPATPTASNAVEEGKTYCFTRTAACLQKTTSTKPMTGRNAQVTQTHKRQGEKTATSCRQRKKKHKRCCKIAAWPPRTSHHLGSSAPSCPCAVASGWSFPFSPPFEMETFPWCGPTSGRAVASTTATQAWHPRWVGGTCLPANCPVSCGPLPLAAAPRRCTARAFRMDA